MSVMTQTVRTPAKNRRGNPKRTDLTPRKRAAIAAETARAILEARGNLTRAAAALGMTRQAVYHRAREYPDVAAAIIEAREARKDRVEDALQNRIDSGDTTAIIFFLKTQAKDRGYVERSELGGPDGGPQRMEVTIIREDRPPLLPDGYRPELTG